MATRDNDDRPKRSWKEIDQAKTLGKTGDSHGGSPSGRAPRDGHVYNAYKRNLDRLFDQGGFAGAKDGAEPGPAQTAKVQERALLEPVSSAQLARALTAFRAKHGMPKDPEVLMACLAIDDERALVEVLAAVAEKVELKAIKRVQTLRSRLKTLLLTCDAPKVCAAAKALLAQL